MKLQLLLSHSTTQALAAIVGAELTTISAVRSGLSIGYPDRLGFLVDKVLLRTCAEYAVEVFASQTRWLDLYDLPRVDARYCNEGVGSDVFKVFASPQRVRAIGVVHSTSDYTGAGDATIEVKAEVETPTGVVIWLNQPIGLFCGAPAETIEVVEDSQELSDRLNSGRVTVIA